ncbi:alpha/beta fold hydrolase [Halomicronema sp. CCY15110]|uniref:alpha/beta fold hydrolase n=1 Tax=Halomicronema sp. CCY15110 TaxID=2767773 RepID=UPI001951ABB5|nr:alpha/beta fold hydrolase [Halomicronema sp. CCY15110]
MSKRFQTIDVGGLKLFVAAIGGGPALMFLHGLGWDHHLWDEAFARYGDRYHVIAGDTRGHGQSEHPDRPYSIRQLAADWFTVLDHMQIDQAILVGFSQGGMVAMEMALQQPERFPALMLACTTCCTPQAVSENLQQRLATLAQMGALATAKLASQSIFSPPFIEQNPDYITQFIEHRAAANQTSLKFAMAAVMGFDVCGQLGQLTQPGLVIAGEQDTLTPPATVAAIHQHYPHSRFVCVPNTGHLIPVEQPEPFYRQIDAALARLSASVAP